MARRIYYTDIKGQKLRQEALRQLRETRRAIDPALLQRVQEVIQQAFGAGSAAPPPEPGAYVFDRRKNLATIEKFLQINPDNKELQRRVHALILREFQ